MSVLSTSVSGFQKQVKGDEESEFLEQESNRVDVAAETVPSSSAGRPNGGKQATIGRSIIQRAPMEGKSADLVAQPAADATPESSPVEKKSGSLIVEDESPQVGSGQMLKSEFLEQLERAVCASADQELARVGRNTQGCPYIERWIGYYRGKSSQHVERALRKYAPEAASVTAARDYIPIVARRITRAVSHWATTGEITGVPEELAGQIPGGGVLGAVGGFLSGVAGAAVGAIGSIGKAIGGLFAKAKDGGAQHDADPESVREQLNAGQSLDGGTKSRMEKAFGHSFSNVKVHADSRAEQLSSDMNARAFTIGSDVAFGAGEYKPGTLVGDALLAHELAHVVQQSQGALSGAVLAPSGGEYNALEENADQVAAVVMVSVWGGAPGTKLARNQNATAARSGGLRLQRCGPSAAKTPVTGPPSAAKTPGAGPESSGTPASAPASSPPRFDAFGKKCPDTVEIADKVAIPEFDKKMFDAGYRTYFGLTTGMKVGPDPSYDACITEVLKPTEDTCGSAGNMSTQNHCAPKKYCMKVGETCGGDELGYATLPCKPFWFVDRHQSHSNLSVLDGTGKTSCKVVCLQRYGCGGKEIGRFYITRNFEAGEFVDGGKKVPITKGTIEKRPA